MSFSALQLLSIGHGCVKWDKHALHPNDQHQLTLSTPFMFYPFVLFFLFSHMPFLNALSFATCLATASRVQALTSTA